MAMLDYRRVPIDQVIYREYNSILELVLGGWLPMTDVSGFHNHGMILYKSPK